VPHRSSFAKHLLLLLVLVALAAGGFWSYRLYSRMRLHLSGALAVAYHLQTLAANPQAAATILQEGGLATLRDELGALEAHLLAIRREASPLLFLCRHAGWIPRLGDDIAAAPALLDMAIELTSAGWWGLLAVDPLAEVLAATDAPSADLLGQTLPLLAAGQPRLLEAREAVARALAARATFDKTGLIQPLRSRLDQIDPYLPILRFGVDAAVLAPTLLGADRARTFLLLAQNNHELRPTGGFISGVGTLQMERGTILSFALEDSYQVSDYATKAHPAPPAPLARYMWAGVLLLRDANWSPDFRTSAEVITSLYQLNRDAAGPADAAEAMSLDGVIAVDLTAIGWLVGAIGPLQLEGYPETVTGDNVLTLLQRYWAAPMDAGTIAEQRTSDWWQHRKDIMGDLMNGVFRRMGELAADSSAATQVGVRLLQAVQKGLAEKHILLYIPEAEIAQVLADNGWDGRLRETDGDFLMVVDANLGFNKVDPQIERHIEYVVDLTQQPALAELRLTYTNTSPAESGPCRREELRDQAEYKAQSYEELMVGCYWDYARVYAPGGSQLLAAEGISDTVEWSEEGGKRVFGAFFGVAPGAQREIRLRYVLSEGVARDGYHLIVQKQPGTLETPLTVRCLFPASFGDPKVMPNAAQALGDQLFYQSTLAMDQEIVVVAQPANRTPLLVLAVGGALLLAVGLYLRLTRKGDES